MDSGTVKIQELSESLEQNGGTARVWAVALLASASPPILLRANVVVGESNADFRDRIWTYESCAFSSFQMPAIELAHVFGAALKTRIELGPAKFTFALSSSDSYFQRRPSLLTYDVMPSRWPSRVYTLAVASGRQQPVPIPAGILVGPGNPTFANFAAAINAFFFDNYALSGANNPSFDTIELRMLDRRGRIKGARIHLTDLEVEVDGDLPPDASIELMAVTDRRHIRVEGSPSVVVPLPNGLPNDAWVWLRTDDDWLDYRSLQETGPYRSPDVQDERPVDLVLDLKAMISRGENQYVEFKKLLPSGADEHLRVALKSIVAFANGEGGTLLYGIEDDGQVIGVEDRDDLEDQLHDRLRHLTSPMPPVKTKCETVDGRKILAVQVEPNTGTIFSLVIKPNKPEYFVRRGATTFYARHDELAKIVAAKIGTQFQFQTSLG